MKLETIIKRLQAALFVYLFATIVPVFATANQGGSCKNITSSKDINNEKSSAQRIKTPYDYLARNFIKKSIRIEDLVSDIANLYPEITWLMAKNAVSPETAAYKFSQDSPSLRYTNGKKHSAEFDRTMVSILTLRQIIRNDYQGFVKDQPQAIKLSKESFKNMRRLFLKVLSGNENGKLRDINYENLDSLISFMAIHDLGKSRFFAEITEKVLSIEKGDHDQILIKGIEAQPVLAPSLNRLSPNNKKMILRGLQAEFNFSQWAQGENIAGSLKGVGGLDTRSFELYLAHFILDVAGVQGHAYPNSAKVMIEPVYKGFSLGEKYVNQLYNGKSSREVYNNYIHEMAGRYDFKIESDLDFATMRLALMSRVNNKAQLETVRSTLESLSSKERSILVYELNQQGLEKDPATLLYYSPGTIANALSYFNNQGSKTPLSDALKPVLKSFAKVFEISREHISKNKLEGVFTIDITRLAELSLENPEKLLKRDFKIESSENPSFADLNFM